MRLTVVGSSDAFNSVGRFHSCYLLEAEGCEPLMIDFGATALAALRKLGREPTELGGIAITHLHGDHVGGFPFLLIDGMFHAVRTRDLPLVGPVGLEARIDRVMRAAYGDLADEPAPYKLAPTEVAPGGSTEVAGYRITGFAADHMDPPEKPLCLRIEAGGKSVAFSGDTRMCEGLLAAADGVDLLVSECSAPAPPCGRHCSWQEWREKLPVVGTKRIVFSHLGTAMRGMVDEALSQVPEGLDVQFADDGLVVEI